MNKIKQWFYMIRLVFVEHLAYIEAQWFDIVGTIVSVFLYYTIWQIIFKKYDSISGYTLNQMTSYIILSRVLSSQFSDGINETLAQWIYSGQIGTEFTRPVSIFTILWTRRFGEFIFFAVFKAMPTLFIAFFVLGGALPFNITYTFLFVISMLISIGIMFMIELLFGMLCCYTLTHYALSFTKTSIMEFLSGGIIPLFLLPGFLEEILNMLPFAGMVYIPINLYLGKISCFEGMKFIFIEIIWIIIFALINSMLFRHVIKKVVVQGG